MTRISYLNGKFLPHEQCFVHIEDRGFQFADGAYEVTLFENGKLIDGQNHAKRLMRSLAELNINHSFSVEKILEIQLELFKKNNYQGKATCYLQITRGATNRLPYCPKNLEPTICATVSPRKTVSEDEFKNGFKIMTHDDIRWHRCDIKTVNLLASTLVNQKAKDSGFDDAIFVRDGIITEATYANVFVVDNEDNLITHPVGNNILGGITRQRLIDIAKENNLNVIEDYFGVDEILKAKEVFLTSSSLLLRPVKSINNNLINYINGGNNFKIAKFLTKKYNEFIENH